MSTYTPNSVAISFYRNICRFFKTCKTLQQIMTTIACTCLEPEMYVKKVIVTKSFKFAKIASFVKVIPSQM